MTRRLNGGCSTTAASLSVVVLTNGSTSVAHDAANAVARACQDLDAQVILVSHGSQDASLSAVARRVGAEVVVAPVGSTRAERCDLAMHHATGPIVTVRDAGDVGDASWLRAFRSVVPKVSEARVIARESTVMETMVVGHTLAADAARPASAREHLGSEVASLEMAAIM